MMTKNDDKHIAKNEDDYLFLIIWKYKKCVCGDSRIVVWIYKVSDSNILSSKIRFCFDVLW